MTRLPTIAFAFLMASPVALAAAPIEPHNPGSSLVRGARAIQESSFPTACQQAARAIQDGSAKVRRNAAVQYREMDCGRTVPAMPVAQQSPQADCSFLRYMLNQGNSSPEGRNRLRREHDRLCR